MRKKDLTKKQKNLLIGFLLAIVLVMAVGYAAFSTQLNISNTASIDSTWNVRITGIQGSNTCTPVPKANKGTENNIQVLPSTKDTVDVTNTSCLQNDASDVTSPTVSADGLTATFSTALVQPGDSRVYEVEVSNLGSLDANVTSTVTTSSNNPAIEITYNGHSATSVLSSVTSGEATLDNTSPFAVVKTTGKKYLYITVKYSDSVTSQPASLNASFTLSLSAEQKVTPPGFTGTIYRYNENLLFLNKPMSGNVTIYYPSSEGYEDAQEAYDAMNFYFDETGCTEDVGEECSSGDVTISPGDYVTSNPSSLGSPVYLKHTIVNNIVTASYVCFTYVPNVEEICLRGGHDLNAPYQSYYASNVIELQKVQAWFNAEKGSDDACYLDSSGSYSNCDVDETIGANASDSGNVNVYNVSSGSAICNVEDTGDSYCF